jgi:hypothetical protein
MPFILTELTEKLLILFDATICFFLREYHFGSWDFRTHAVRTSAKGTN